MLLSWAKKNETVCHRGWGKKERKREEAVEETGKRDTSSQNSGMGRGKKKSLPQIRLRFNARTGYLRIQQSNATRTIRM